MFTVGQRVTRVVDGASGTVESVQPYQNGVAVAVRLDSDGEVWSGTEQAWQRVTSYLRPVSPALATVPAACPMCLIYKRTGVWGSGHNH